MRLELAPGEKVVADRGYRGDSKICTPDDWKDAAHKKAMSNARARQETVNGRLKNWGCLTQNFRHDRNRHHLVTKAALVMTQLSISTGNPLFQVIGYVDCPLA